MGWLLLIAMIVVYIILGILYESFIHPLTILSGLPSAAVGALLTLYLFGVPLTLYAFVGMIMLIGIVKKNAIMMIDFALNGSAAATRACAEQAIYEAAMIRFRPIMMTTMAALMGTLPIALGTGMGADSRRPLGLCVAGGLSVLAAADALHHAGDLYLSGRPRLPTEAVDRPGRPNAFRLAVTGQPFMAASALGPAKFAHRVGDRVSDIAFKL